MFEPADSHNIIRAASVPASRWAGGTTSQLGIWPAGSDYAERNFEYRISTATVEQSGAFTALPGYRRILMLLNGDGLQLDFEGGESRQLIRPGNQIHFDGGVKVEGRLLGQPIRDFNVIFRPDLEVGVRLMNLAAKVPITVAGESRHVWLYCLDGEVSISTATAQTDLLCGDTLRILTPNMAQSIASCTRSARLIEVTVKVASQH